MRSIARRCIWAVTKRISHTWYHPMLFYVIAAGLKFAALSEAAVRLPNALIGGVLTPFLIYGAARRMRFGFSGAIAAAI